MINLCVIGCGVVASGWHGPSYIRYKENGGAIRLLACCDANETKAESFRNRFHFERSYTDYEEMLEKERPHAVCILISESGMASVATEVLRRSIPCLIEKPPGLDCAEVDQLIQLAAENDVPHQVALNRRFMPLLIEAKDRLPKDGAPPGLQFASLEVVRYDRRDPDFSTTAIHGIDTLRFVLDDEFSTLDFQYVEMPALGRGVANFQAQGVTRRGIGVQVHFCPVAGARFERLTLHSLDRTLIVELPENSFSRGSAGLMREIADGNETFRVNGEDLVGTAETFVTGGAYAENVDFFEALQRKVKPRVDLLSARESVAIMQSMRERRGRYCYDVDSVEESAAWTSLPV